MEATHEDVRPARSPADDLGLNSPPRHINHTGTVRIDKTPEVPAVRSDDNPTKRQHQLIDRKIFAAVVIQVLANMFDIEMLVQASWMSLASVTALRT